MLARPLNVLDTHLYNSLSVTNAMTVARPGWGPGCSRGRSPAPRTSPPARPGRARCPPSRRSQSTPAARSTACSAAARGVNDFSQNFIQVNCKNMAAVTVSSTWRDPRLSAGRRSWWCSWSARSGRPARCTASTELSPSPPAPPCTRVKPTRCGVQCSIGSV